MATSGNPRIGPTAHFTAQAWRREGFANADRFDTTLGRLFYGAVDGAARVLGPFAPSAIRYHSQYLVIRHHVYEARLAELAPTFVLEVGAGLSPRGVTLAGADPSLTYVEVDLPDMVAAKRARLGELASLPNYHLAACDLLGDDFVAALPVAPAAGDRVVVITEGVTDYLSMAEKRVAWRNIAAALDAAGGGTYLLELYLRERWGGRTAGSRLVLSALAAVTGRSFDDRLFDDLDAGLTMLEDAGFAARALDAAALNPSRHAPPMDACPWMLIEATRPA